MEFTGSVHMAFGLCWILVLTRQAYELVIDRCLSLYFPLAGYDRFLSLLPIHKITTIPIRRAF